MPLFRRLAAHTSTATAAIVLAGSVAAVGLYAVPEAGPSPAGCAAPLVPGAQHQIAACLGDLTTAGTVASGHTVPADWAGLHPAGAQNPATVPGTQIDGYFPDDSTTNANHGWNHDSQFVIRLPEHWNGGLVVAGTPGNRRQYANDFTISDWVLAQGYAYAATDKGNTGVNFFRDGAAPGDAMLEWHHRVTQLTVAAQAVVAQRYGRLAAHTYMAGVSNGGYLVRWQLENAPWLYDGGVDWEGTLWSDAANPLSSLPTVLANYPDQQSNPDAHAAVVAAGFPAESEPLWAYHAKTYWGLTQGMYRQELDPDYTGDEAVYDYAARPAAVRDAVARIGLTGRIQRPLITIHGTLDALLPIGDSDRYDGMIRDQGRADLHRYYRFEGGNHVDGLYDQHPALLRPLLPCFRSAFTALESWLTAGQLPPANATLPRPASGDPANACALSN
ncbi:tannase/feruloyl esterase family alpha/beta hydrolase [Nocardia huaxiensis]|uniref:Tannase/feruloyl esterase family alpha/beta hydrolase n=1 Tax=Nocardia huaxiensis TaxID=2755382 RepID=A0A7D6V8M0_9NOCA|nr:tannase/feruloyl esterase family alpha/beta hydrolase [Nocardia huaxiensis]QLY30432.1 tannase/feruloyl esterase family alpha/beta hydrolase [Nocardia huaxiensis]UFS95971.1 tannase/feruloyl esterase family alpha/beta hydrolase [Nocardia huaxiensis]